jgi:hypothetical protein
MLSWTFSTADAGPIAGLVFLILNRPRLINPESRRPAIYFDAADVVTHNCDAGRALFDLLFDCTEMENQFPCRRRI